MTHTSGNPLGLWPLRLKAHERLRGRLLVLLYVAGLLILVASCGGQAEPTPGATFRGSIETGTRAGGGAIDFAISEDGTSISDLGITLSDVACDGLTAGMTTDHFSGSLASIADGRFGGAIAAVLTASGHQSQGVLTSGGSMTGTGPGGTTSFQDYRLGASPEEFPVVASLETVGQLEGEFSSASEAAGTIRIHVWVIGTDRACELGTFPWSAAAS